MLRQIDLSVVVAVADGAATLARSLQSIIESDFREIEIELIVVDDASDDGSPAIAARYADTVVRLTSRRSGRAYARNRGAEIARGRLVAFIDQDIAVKPETLRLMVEALDKHPGLDAVAATHDHRASAGNFMSEYWSVLLSVGESSHAGVGGGFGSGCGVVRRSSLASSGMYDEWRFGTGTLEGVELGQRLLRTGHDVLLTRDLRVAQLRRWTVRAAFRETFTRSALLARSLGYQQTRASSPADVVFTLTRPALPLVGALSTVALLGAFMPGRDGVLITAVGVLLAVIADARTVGEIARLRGAFFALRAIPVHLCLQAVSVAGLCSGWLMRDAVGDPRPDAATQAYAEVGVEMWPPVPRPR
ncbi:MAG TPA: glycosyltransferase [Gemmatimonadaceae bacterium]|jgi:GT2 family glycosyltransferase|nr:glycosyltransferase [Gemmatimonadaceae bacterium]